MNNCMKIYKDAELYDAEFSERSHEIPFYLRWAKKVDGKTLEVACGTGRITKPLADEGVNIIGSDLCPSMIQRAQEKFPTMKWLVQDCRSISMNEKFDLIFSATNAMQHLHDSKSILGFLNSAREHLSDRGLLILDVFNPHPAKLSRSVNEEYLHKKFDDVKVMISSEYDRAHQLLKFTLRYLREGCEFHRKNIAMRCFYPEELLLFCHAAGLEVVDRFGDYEKADFSKDSPQQILVCRSIG